MTAEAPMPNNRMGSESQRPVDFYNPITDRAKTLEKLTLLSVKEQPTDEDLFQVIADTFATIATIDFEAGVMEIVGNQKFKAEDWQHTDEFIFHTEKFPQIFIGYHQPKEGETIPEEAFIQGVNSDSQYVSTNFRRDNDSINVYKYNEERDEEVPYEIPLGQRKVIVETLLEVMNSKQPVVA